MSVWPLTNNRRRELAVNPPPPRPANGPAPAPTPRVGPANSSRYMPGIPTTAAGRMMPATRHASFPPAPAMRELGAHALADAIDAHVQADRDFHAAVAAVDAAEPPGGAAWRAAVAADRDTAELGDSAVTRLLASRPALIGGAVLDAHAANRAFDAVLREAAAATEARDKAEQELDAWVLDACAKVRRGIEQGSRIPLAEVEHDQKTIYPTLRARWAWLANAGTVPYRPTPGAADKRLGDVIAADIERLNQIWGPYGMFGSTATSTLLPGGDWS
jgi:hypothetical protein